MQWEKSTALLKEARERDLAVLNKRLRHLEEEVIPGLRARAEAAEAREKQLRNELTVAHARIKQIEAMAQEKLAQKERQLAGMLFVKRQKNVLALLFISLIFMILIFVP